MLTATQYILGDEAACTDGACGVVRRLVVDPVTRKVTHLVVDPKHGNKPGRLVPLDLVHPSPRQVQVRCSLAEFEQLRAAEETEFLPGADGFTSEQALSWPYYSLGYGGLVGPTAPIGAERQKEAGSFYAVTYDAIPVGEVEVRRGDQVHAVDGEIGHVEGLVIDPANHGATHVLLREGHLWGRKKVAIPIKAVISVRSGVHLNLTKAEVGALPAVEVDMRR